MINVPIGKPITLYIEMSDGEVAAIHGSINYVTVENVGAYSSTRLTIDYNSIRHPVTLPRRARHTAPTAIRQRLKTWYQQLSKR